MSFGIIALFQYKEKKGNYVTWLKTVIAYIKIEDIFEDIAKDVDAKFDT